jgi:hypothetical protein
MNYTAKINLSKVDKNRLFKGEKGIYLDLVIFTNPEADQYGQHGMIVQSVSKEERQQGIKGEIIGNVAEIKGSEPQPLTQQDKDDLPF